MRLVAMYLIFLYFCYILADLYVTDQDKIPRQITDDSVIQLAEIPVKMPLLSGVQPGSRIDVTIEFVFGFTEIKLIIYLADTISEHLLESENFIS